MFRELLELSHELERNTDFPPPGFYRYSANAPIRWVVRIVPGQPLRVRLLPLELHNLRPYSGRTSGVAAYPLADEAGYALGLGGSDDDKARAFRELLVKMADAPELANPRLQYALELVIQVVEDRLVVGDPLFPQVKEKDWVSFIVDEGELTDRHLFEHPSVQRFWFRHLGETVGVSVAEGVAIVGECSACGVERPLAGRIPLGVKLSKPSPLISQNADAYISRVEGPKAFERATLSLCLECGDAAARALNYLSNSEQHCRQLILNPLANDNLSNYHALFWLRRAPVPTESAQPIVDLAALLNALPAPMERATAEPKRPIAPPPILAQLERLLTLPWTAHEHATSLSEAGFYLLLLSPNKGRITVRDWIAVSLGTLRGNLIRFLDALRIIGLDGANPRAFTIPMILDALKRPKSKLADAENTRGLLRAAYLGEHPDRALLTRALARFRSALRSLDEKQTGPSELPPALRLQICAAVLKLFCLFGKEDASDMTTLDDHPAFLSGRMLAVLEEIQRRAAGKTKLNATLIDRLYSAAAMAPAATLGMAIGRAQSGHLPKLRRERRGFEQMQQRMQELSGQLAERGGFPPALDPVKQAEFALGYYTERATFNPAPIVTTSPTDEKGA